MLDEWRDGLITGSAVERADWTHRLEAPIGHRADTGRHREVDAAHHALHVLGELREVSGHADEATRR